MGEKIGGGVGGGAPGVGAQDGGVVAVRVSGALGFGHGDGLMEFSYLSGLRETRSKG